MIKYRIMQFTMWVIYCTLRHLALLSHSDKVKHYLYNLWWKIGGRWADGAFSTGHMCQCPTDEEIAKGTYEEEVDLGFN